MNIKKRFLVFFLVLLVLTSFTTFALAVDVTILHTNDTHGRIASFINGEAEVGGFARLYTMIQQIKKNNSNVIVLDGGDTFHGTNLVNLEQGLNAAALLGTLGYDAMVPGNHDFNYGYERLLAYSKVTNYPILSANVEKAGNLVFKPYTIIARGGYRFAIIGLTTTTTPIATHPNNVIGLDFIDPVTKVKEVVEEVQDKVDFIIVLSHIGADVDRRIAEQVPEVDIIVGGHSHTELPGSTPTTIINQSGEYGKNLGMIQMTIEDGKIIASKVELLPVTKEIKGNPMVEFLIGTYQKRLDSKLGQIAGSSAIDLVGERENVRTKETNLGNLIADVMLNSCDADVAVTNGGGIRSPLKAGSLTIGDIYTVLPFDNTLVVIEVTGDQLQRALEHSVRLYPGQNGGFLHIAGMSFSFVASNPAGSRVQEVMVNGKSLQADQVYKVATNDFLAVGGDGYTMFNEGRVSYESGLYLRDLMVDYLNTQGSVAPEVEGRIIVK